MAGSPATTLPPLHRRAPLIATAVLLGGPTLLAFFAGGYFDGPRAAALVVAWALVLWLSLAGPERQALSANWQTALGLNFWEAELLKRYLDAAAPSAVAAVGV